MITKSAKDASADEIDPLIRNRMDDWGELLTCDGVISKSEGGTAPNELDYTRSAQPFEQQMKSVLNLDMPSKRVLLKLWFRHVINGSTILYPTTDSQVWYYSVHDSDIAKYIFELTTCFLMILPTLYSPYCNVREDQMLEEPPPDPLSKYHLIFNWDLTGLLLLGIVVQFVDIFLHYKSSTLDDVWNSKNAMVFDKSNFWKAAKFLTCVAVFLDCIAYFVDTRNPLLMRALIPILFISRRDNMQHLFEGTLFAVRKSWPIYRIVLVTIIIWAFLGFCMFSKLKIIHTIHESGSHFNTYWSSLYTCFRCYLSRPSALWTLSSYYRLNHATAMFFVTLTLVADIFGSSLIIATGTRHFRDFSLLCFRFKLKSRRAGLLALFNLLEDMQRHTRASSVDRTMMKSIAISDSSKLSGELSFETWLVFCSCIWGHGEVEVRQAVTAYAAESPSFYPISKMQFFRLCGILASNPRFRKLRAASAGPESSAELEPSPSHRSDEDTPNPLVAQYTTQQQVQTSDIHSNSHSASAGAVDMLRERAAGAGQFSMLDIGRNAQHCMTSLTAFARSIMKSYSTKQQRQRLIDMADTLAHFGSKIEFGQSAIGRGLKALGMKTRVKFKPFSLLSLGAHAVLIYQLSEISGKNPTTGGIALSWALLLFFSFENAVHYLAGSEDRATTIRDMFINLLVFFTMCFLGTDVNDLSSKTLTALILFQSLRSMKLFSALKGAQALYAIQTVVFRAFLLIGCFVYFFSIFGHVFFCGAFDATSADRANDDARTWTRYSHILNFDTFLMSCYTLSQIVVISNWSMIMDAALLIAPYRGFAFFYSFKALMTLAVMPLMISLIIQAFIAQLGRKELDTIRQKMKVFTISSDVTFSSTMVAMWSPNGRETIASPLPVAEGPIVHRAQLLRQIESIKDEIRKKKRLVDDLLIRERFSKTQSVRTSVAALPVDEIPSPSLAPPKPSSSISVTAKVGADTDPVLQWAASKIEVSDLRILLEMKEWASLRDDKTLRSVGKYERNLYAAIGMHEQWELERAYLPSLAYLWFHDSIHARHIDLPTSHVSLYLYSTHRSKWFLNVCNVLVVLQVLSTLFVSSPCPRGSMQFSSQSSELHTIFAVVNLTISFLYCSETATNLYLGGQGGNWTKVRLTCCFFVIVDTLVYLMGSTPRSLPSSAIFPLFWITRSNTFREVVMGLLSSLRKSALVYNLLLAFLMVWSLVGYYMFHRFDTPLMHFKTFPSTVFTVLHCFTAAPYALDALQPLFVHSKFVVLYFLIITLTMEVVTLSLIVATADMQFRLFAANNLKRRLSLRRDALVAIWCLFSKDDHLSAENWLFLCSGLKSDFEINALSAEVLFSFVTNRRSEGATQVDFFKLMGLIHSRARATLVYDSDDADKEGAVFKHSDVEMTKIYPPRGAKAKATPSPSRRTSSAPHRSIRIEIKPKRQTLLSDATLTSGMFGKLRSVCQSLLFTDLFVLFSTRVKILDAISFGVHILLIPQLMYIATARHGDRFVGGWVAVGWLLELCFWADMIVRVVGLGELTFIRRESHLARAIINAFSLVCKGIVDYSSSSSSSSIPLQMLIFIQCSRLFLMFWVEQGASNIAKIFKVAARCVFLLFSVIFFFTIYAQSSFCHFMQPEVVEQQERIMTSYAGLQLATDDANAWVFFQDILNFDSYLQSMFTLFQIAVLGSWSMIMDAAAKTDAVKAFGFFYPYRLVIILAVLPLLNGLVIRSYVLIMDQKDSRHDDDAKDDGLIDEQLDGIQEEEDGNVFATATDSAIVARASFARAARESQIRTLDRSMTASRRTNSTGLLNRVWRGMTVNIMSPQQHKPSSILPENRLRNESTRIERSSFLSFWATGSGNMFDANDKSHSAEVDTLQYENLVAESCRLDEAIRTLAPTQPSQS